MYGMRWQEAPLPCVLVPQSRRFSLERLRQSRRALVDGRIAGRSQELQVALAGQLSDRDRLAADIEMGALRLLTQRRVLQRRVIEEHLRVRAHLERDWAPSLEYRAYFRRRKLQRRDQKAFAKERRRLAEVKLTRHRDYHSAFLRAVVAHGSRFAEFHAQRRRTLRKLARVSTGQGRRTPARPSPRARPATARG